MQLSTGLMYLPELNKVFYSNDYIINSGVDLKSISAKLGSFAEYISDDERDLLYAESIDIKIFDEEYKDFDYTLKSEIDLDSEITKLQELNPDYSDNINDEYEYVCKNEHNILLLKMAFILKNHLDRLKSNVYMMRGSGISSFLFYTMNLNRVNPLKFNLDYRNFWQ